MDGEGTAASQPPAGGRGARTPSGRPSAPEHVSKLILAGLPIDLAATGDRIGRAVSADPTGADPDEVQVWGSDGRPWRIDRRSTRVSEPGDGLEVVLVERVADLVDRAQLVLGFPVEIEWIEREGEGEAELIIVQVERLTLERHHADGPFRRVALTAADEGVVAPLTIDALDHGLSAFEEEGPRVGQTVRRIYGRPYKRRNQPSILGRLEPTPLLQATAACATATKTVAPLLTGAFRFDKSSGARFHRLASNDLQGLDDEGLLAALREREQFVAEAFLQLDRSREATRQALHALEATIGALPEEVYPALAAPRSVRARRKYFVKLRELADAFERAGVDLGTTDPLPSALARQWREVARELTDVRPLGINVLHEPIGNSDRALRDALRLVGTESPKTVERRRKDAKESVLRVARSRSLRRMREVLVRPLLTLLDRVADAKGRLSEGTARSLVLLRSAAVETGRRLVDMAILDEPEDALYLWLAELEDALRGEPGAYAARVRLRREDDARWAQFDAPRNLR